MALVLALACAREPTIDVDRLVCVTDDNCPAGRICKQNKCVLPSASARDAADEVADAPGAAGADGLAADQRVPDAPMPGAGGAQGDGAVATGGTSGSDGPAGSGGAHGTGGVSGFGGSAVVGAGGAPASTGGRPAAGGTIGGGGITGNGGASRSGGATGSGGVTGNGGSSSTGGTTRTGGVTGTGGITGTGGVTVVGSGGTTASGGTTSTGGATTVGPGPCDIYAAASPATPCAAAYSMVRTLSSSYRGPLYQVRNGSSSTNMGTGGATLDIGMTLDGYADRASQDTFCAGTVCTVSKLYDQSGNGNDLMRGTAGPSAGGTRAVFDDYEASATGLSVTAGGHKVYALYMPQYGGYRTPLGVVGKGVPVGSAEQGIYELADGTHFGSACCWDFGNASPDPNKYVTMNTLFFGTGFWGAGAGAGPWFMGDFEGGVWAGGSGASNSTNPSNPSLKVPFALGILHTPVGKYALRMADASTASDLTTAYDGAIPAGKTWDNAGGIVLGVGGDNSNNSYGTFYEGAITAGSPSNATDLAVLKNIQAVGYSK